MVNYVQSPVYPEMEYLSKELSWSENLAKLLKVDNMKRFVASDQQFYIIDHLYTWHYL